MGRNSFFDCLPNRDNVLHVFHEIQKASHDRNFISNDNVAEVADFLGISIAEVYGVRSFYRLFSGTPRGKFVIRLCDSLSCRVNTSLKIYNKIKKELRIKKGETTDDGLFSLEIVNCLGSCDTAPNMMINDKLYTNLTADKVDDILARYRSGEDQ